MSFPIGSFSYGHDDELRQQRQLKSYSTAVNAAIKLHCKGEFVTDDIACFCREEAANLDRDLARSRGQELPKLGTLKDYTS